MYHCESCGWDGPEPARHQEPLFTREGTSFWVMRVCPECGEEVYETRILRAPPMDPECP